MNYDEKPARPKMKLKPDSPTDELMSVDKAFMALIAFVVGLMILVALFAPKQNQTPQGEPLGIEQQSEEYQEGPGKTWKEPGSARDAFDQNFGR